MTENKMPRILHIEDNSDISLIVAKVLSNIAEITHVDNLSQAREKLTEDSFDLAILDLVLPDGSGLDLVTELKNKQPPVPVIIHSAHEVSENIHDVDAVLSKMHTQHDVLRSLVRKLTGMEPEQEATPKDAVG